MERWTLEITTDSLPFLLKWLKEVHNDTYYNASNFNWGGCRNFFEFPSYKNNGYCPNHHLSLGSNATEDKKPIITLEKFKELVYFPVFHTKQVTKIINDFPIY